MSNRLYSPNAIDNSEIESSSENIFMKGLHIGIGYPIGLAFGLGVAAHDAITRTKYEFKEIKEKVDERLGETGPSKIQLLNNNFHYIPAIHSLLDKIN